MSVRIPMMIVQDENCADHTAGHHKHYAIEVRPWKKSNSVTLKSSRFKQKSWLVNSISILAKVE